MPTRYFFKHTWELISTRRFGNLCVALICCLAVFQLALSVYLAENARKARMIPMSAQSMMAYLKGKTTQAERLEISRAMSGMQGVAAVMYVPRAQGFERMRKWLGDDSPLIMDLEADVLPDAYEIRLKDSSLHQADLIAQRIQSLPLVEDVHYNKGLVAHVASIYPGLRLAGILIACLSAIVFSILIFQTNRLALHAHTTELEVLGLLGADRTFLYAPYIAFTVLIILLSALPGCIAAQYTIKYVRNHIPYLTDFLAPFSMLQLSGVLSFTLLCALAGALRAIRR